uniref:Uncharacterized protein n=1 Tax=Ananas comosus var. bracteatus TaxID=296719 RepID=A0A6V7NSQ7_ANACO|nr:unnamed protein product [Ananas comosus var. bracteatus]
MDNPEGSVKIHRRLREVESVESSAYLKQQLFNFHVGSDVCLQQFWCTVSRQIYGLWDAHFESMSEDYHHDILDHARVEQLVLRDISNFLESMGKKLTCIISRPFLTM